MNSEPGTPTADRGTQKEILRGILQKFIDTQEPAAMISPVAGKVDYKEMVQLLHPVAMEYRKRVGLEDEPKEESSPVPSMIISLDEQLEWQESSRTHSPRTPSAPEALRNLRRGTPPQTPPRSTINPEGLEDIRETSSLAGFTALILMAQENVMHKSTIRGDHLYLADGTVLPLSLPLPLRVRVINRRDDGSNADYSVSEEGIPLTAGSAWLSIIAERTYESSLASLLRARRTLQEICIEDRIILNRFLKGSMSLSGLKSTRLWSGPVDEPELDESMSEHNTDLKDVLSEKLRVHTQRIALDEKKRLLKEQQVRLRRLLARELQRIHSAKPATAPTAPTRMVTSEDLAVEPNPPPKRAIDAVIAPLVSETPKPTTRVLRIRDKSILHYKLKELEIEWYRIGDIIRRSIEDETSLERRIKRLRYVS